MVARNDMPIVFSGRFCRRRIPLRQDLVANIPSIPMSPKGDGWKYILERWAKRRCLLYYNYKPWPDWRPTGEAMLFIECPLSYEFFEWICRGIKREVIIYRPPDWSMQEEMIKIKNPDSSQHRAVMFTSGSFMHGPRNVQETLALNLSGFSQETTKVFTRKEVAQITNISERAVRAILRKHGKNHHQWYQPLRLNHAPDDPELAPWYAELEEQSDWGDGLRMIRNGIGSYKMSLLLGAGAITYYPPVHVLAEGWRLSRTEALDVTFNLRQSDWYNMRKLVEDAAQYEDL